MVRTEMNTRTQLLATAGAAVLRQGYAFVGGAEMEAHLRGMGLQDWGSFQQSWDDLDTDIYMADGGRYRRRRFAAFSASATAIVRKPHQPHYQSRDYNPLNGGIERWFKPVTDMIAAHPVLRAILRTCHELFDGLTPADARPASWHVEVHQFRIEARSDQEGRPTPEGMHRDGVDWALVLLVTRKNIESGTTTIYDLAKRPLGSFTLAAPFDSAIVDDHRVFHGVTAVRPHDPSSAAHRDVLVVTFRREQG